MESIFWFLFDASKRNTPRGLSVLKNKKKIIFGHQQIEEESI
jgi:hypothetical protein